MSGVLWSPATVSGRTFPSSVINATIATKLDRLARSVPHLLSIIDRVKAKEATIEIGNLGRLDDTATDKLMTTVLGAIAAFEREIMLERQREGIAAAKAAG
jgi:DNA invertase Pin-like site-specific DNA recombinase